MPRLAISLLLGIIALLATPVHAETLKVRLVMSDDTSPYQQFSDALNKELYVRQLDVVAESSQISVGDASPDLIIAAGTKAAKLAIAQSGTPVLNVMITRTSYEGLLENRPAPHQAGMVSAIYLDQPWDRQLNFIRVALPKHRLVGLLYSPEARITLPRLPPGMSLNARSVRSTAHLFDTLENILNDSEVLLAVPDSGIYNNNNVRNILLTSYRYKVPLIGISQAYVNAGALGAIYSTPEQLAEQAVKVIASFARNRHLPEPQYPVSFSIALNQQVARSLGIALDSAEEIRMHMGEAGEGRR